MIGYVIGLIVCFLVTLICLVLIKLFDRQIRENKVKWVIYFPIATFIGMLYCLIAFIISTMEMM